MSSLLKSASVSDSARARLLHVLRTSFGGGAPSAVDSVSDSGDDLAHRAQPLHSVFIYLPHSDLRAGEMTLHICMGGGAGIYGHMCRASLVLCACMHLSI